jgi:hypothetical protein
VYGRAVTILAMKAALLSLALLTGCATATDVEKTESGIARMAFGAPLILGGVGGVASSGVSAIVINSALPSSGPAVNGGLLAGAGVSVVFGVAGAILFITGEGLLDDGLAPTANVVRAERAQVRPKKVTHDIELEPPSKKPPPCHRGWDCDEDEGGPSRVVTPGGQP